MKSVLHQKKFFIFIANIFKLDIQNLNGFYKE
jgi:hypothetical protein